MIIGLLGIILSLVLLITLAYRGTSIIIAAPLCALLAMLFSGAPLLATYTEIFMPALANFIKNYFPIFLTGAIFGRLMAITGYAEAIAQTITKWLGPKQAILATVITAAILTYGGISVFVAVFVMFPLAKELFRAADLPRRLIPAAISVGILTFTMTAIPGTPQIQNIIPGQFFGTSTFAAPVIGITGGILMFVLGWFWVQFRAKRLVAAGEGFGDATDLERKAAAREAESRASAGGSGTGGGGVSTMPITSEASERLLPAPPNALFPFIPIIAVFAVNLACTMWLFPSMDWGYLAEEQYGGITLQDRTAVWAVLCALLAAIVVILVMNFRHLKEIWDGFIFGAQRSLLPIFSTASEVGYGAVIAAMAAFAIIKGGILNPGMNALVASAVSTSTIAGITGSASGGMTIALNAVGEDLTAMAMDQGIALDAMHRVTAMASGGLDSMPHNGAVITLLMVCGMTHRESYKDVGMVSIVIPVAVTALVIAMVTFFGIV